MQSLNVIVLLGATLLPVPGGLRSTNTGMGGSMQNQKPAKE